MANVIDIALRNIYMQIPREILELAFEDERKRTSLDECIVKYVIDGRVRPDVSVAGGKYKEIMMDPSWVIVTKVPPITPMGIPMLPYAIYQIPEEARDFRPITQVISLRTPYGTMSTFGMAFGGINPNSGTSVNAGSMACTYLNEFTGANKPITPDPILLDGSHVKLTPIEMSLTTTFSYVLECRIDFDRDFTNLTPDAIHPLSDLILVATQAFIFTRLVIKLDAGYIRSGAEIGRIREIVDSYSTAAERYNELRSAFHGGSVTLDQETMREMLLLQV